MNYDSKREIDTILKSNNHYEVLGIGPKATKQDIKQAYRASALKYHPDKNPLPQAKELFHKVTTAYEHLTSDQNRPAFQAPSQNQQGFGASKNSSSKAQTNHQRENYRSADEKHSFGNKQKPYKQKPDYSKYFKPAPNPYNPKRSEPPSYEKQPNPGSSKSSEEPYVRSRQSLKLRHRHTSWASIIFTFIMFFLFWKFVPDFTSRQPKFLLSPTPQFSLKVKTSRYKFPYYIKPDTLGSTVVLDSKVEQLHLRKLEADCQSALNLKQKYEKLLLTDASHSSFWQQQMQTVNYQACKKILKLVKKYPEIELNRFTHLLK